MWRARFWKDAAERAAKSAAQALVIYLVGDAPVFDAWHVNWRAAAGIAGGAALLSVLTSVISSRIGDPESASLVETK